MKHICRFIDAIYYFTENYNKISISIRLKSCLLLQNWLTLQTTINERQQERGENERDRDRDRV